MSKSSWLVVALALALMATNAWWAYRTLDLGVSLTYAKSDQDENAVLVQQLLDVLNTAISSSSSRSEVIASAKAGIANEPFEKHGFVWVNALGMKFNNDGRLVKAVVGEGSVEQ